MSSKQEGESQVPPPASSSTSPPSPPPGGAYLTGPVDPFFVDPDTSPNPTVKIDKIRVHLPLRTIQKPPSLLSDSGGGGISGGPPSSLDSTSVYLDICFRTRATSANSFRFKKGWLSYSTVEGIKTVVFREAADIVKDCKVDNAVNSKSNSLLGHSVYHGKWIDVSSMDPMGFAKPDNSKRPSIGDPSISTASLLYKLGMGSRHEVTSDLKIVMTFVPGSGEEVRSAP